jgi:hypothetical protein
VNGNFANSFGVESAESTISGATNINSSSNTLALGLGLGLGIGIPVIAAIIAAVIIIQIRSGSRTNPSASRAHLHTRPRDLRDCADSDGGGVRRTATGGAARRADAHSSNCGE